MAYLKPDKSTNCNGVTVNEFLLTNHNPNGIDMPGYNLPSKPLGVTVHNTDWIQVASETTPAEQYTRATYNGNMKDVRVHYYVDNKCAWQNLPLTLSGWHAADGNGDGNRKTIAIECIMESVYDDVDKKSEDNCARLAAWLLHKYGLTIDHLYTHSHWLNVRDGKTGSVDTLNTMKNAYKNCPAYILPHWSTFKAKVKSYLDALNKPASTTTEKVLDASGYKKGDKTIGSLSLKELLILAKELGLHTYGMNEDNEVGPGTTNAINALLKKWGYKQTGIAGANFIKKLKAEISKKIKK